ncbi:MAG: TonB family protein [Holophagaceae bacterium]
MNPDPTSIGRYQVQSLLGRGGMGAVYLAQDPLLKRLVVIKVVHEKGASYDHALERFQREAEISAKLNHPNVITVHDVGTDTAMGPFIAMEYVKGQSLAAMIRAQGPLPVDQVLRIVVQAARALHAAGAEGIVHRDVKPENILVTPEGRVKLTDFGIAKLGESNLTTVGGVVGTPSYIAPELLKDAVATPATDCYALAVTAFEALTGDLPFKGDSVASMLLKIVQEPPTLPASLSPALAGVFCKAFEKQPSRRYPDVNAFAGALVHAVPLATSARTKLLLVLAGEDVSLHGSIPGGTHTLALPDPDATPATAGGLRPAPSAPALQPPPPMPPAPMPPAAPPATRPASSPEARPLPPPPAREPAPRRLPPPPPPPVPTWAPGPAAGAPVGDRPSSTPARGFLIAAALGSLTLAVVGGGAWAIRRRTVPSQPASADAFQVLSDPEGATVSADGTVVGTTPLRGWSPKAGGQVLRLEKAGFEPQELPVRPGDGEVRLTLRPLPAASAPQASAPPAAGGDAETDRLQAELKRLREANAREEARLRQGGKAAPRPGAAASAAAPSPGPASPAPASATPASPAPQAPAQPPAPALPAHREAALVRLPAPAYPRQASGNLLLTLREQRVRLKVLVGETGLPLQIQVVQGVGRAGFDEAAMAAARQATYLPAVQGGRPARAWIEFTVAFPPSR